MRAKACACTWACARARMLMRVRAHACACASMRDCVRVVVAVVARGKELTAWWRASALIVCVVSAESQSTSGRRLSVAESGVCTRDSDTIRSHTCRCAWTRANRDIRWTRANRDIRTRANRDISATVCVPVITCARACARARARVRAGHAVSVRVRVLDSHWTVHKPFARQDGEEVPARRRCRAATGR